MPPRKEPKETVVYPASKRKAPPFKPQRPSKVARVPTADLEKPRVKAKTLEAAAPARRKEVIRIEEDEDEDEEEESGGEQNSAKAGRRSIDASDSDEELDDNPLAAVAKPHETGRESSNKLAAAQRPQEKKQATASPSPSPSIFPPSRRASNTSFEPPPIPTQSDLNTAPAIPQPLLIRLLHEHFADKKTKIDRHAVQVLQKYFETFLREAIVRAKLRKEEDVAAAAAAGAVGGMGDADATSLEREDLEKVAAGMLFDF